MRPRGRRAARDRAADGGLGPRTSGRTRCSCSATRSTPTRCRRRRSSSSAARRDTSEPPGETIADFEEYTQPLPRGVDRPADPLAALHRALGDDLRRPRRHRRLEHVDRVARGDARHRLVGPARGRRLHEPTCSTSTGATCRPTRSRRRRSTSSVRDAGDGGDILAASTPTSATARSRARAGATAATSAATRVVMIDSRAGRVLTPGERSMVDAGEWRLDHRARHRRLRPPADRHLAAAVPRARRCTTSRPGTRRSATARGARSAAKLGEKLRQGADLEHWPAFRDSFNAHVRAAARGRRRAARPRARSIDRRALRRRAPRLPRRGRLPGGQRRAARASGRRPARRSATRSARRSAAASTSASRRAGKAIGRLLARSRRRAAAAGALALPGRRPALRQPGRHARARRAPRAGAPRARDPVRATGTSTRRWKLRTSTSAEAQAVISSSHALKTCAGCGSA